jgi:glycosyltransferase involved in cell wall biosynthesis
MNLEMNQVHGLPVWTLDLDPEPMLKETVLNTAAACRVLDLAQSQGFDLLHVQHLMDLSGEVVMEAQRRDLPSVLTLHDFWLLCHLIFLQTPDLSPCPGTGEEHCLDCLFTHLYPQARQSGQTESLINFHRFRESYHRRLFQTPAKVLAVSRYLYDVFRQRGWGGPNFAVLPAGVQPFALAQRGRPNPRPIFTFMGELTPNKGALLAAKAFAGLTGGELHLYGRAPNPAYLEAVLEICRRHPETMTFHGPFQPEQRGRILAQADLVVVPSLMESHGLVVREALYAGRPVAASAVGGIPEAVEPGVNGLLFPPGDESALRECLARLLEHPEEIAALTRGVQPPHTVSDDADRYLEIYSAALAQST